MRLDISATSYPGGAISEADYDHTVVLGPVGLMTDDGVPIHDVGGLHVTGTSGITYALVPEPSSLVLAAFGALSLTAWGWRRKRRLAPIVQPGMSANIDLS